MYTTETVRTSCPFCGEPIHLVVDCSVEAQRYTEDCPVCCQPIEVSVQVDDTGQPQVSVSSDELD